MNKKLLLPLSTRAAITENSYNEADRTIEVVFATETPVKRRGWNGESYVTYNEILNCETKSVRLERANAGANLVDSHSTYSVNSILGVVVKAWVENKECKAVIRLSKREEVKGIIEDIIEGITRNISVGYTIHATDTSEDSDGNITVRVSDWEVAEISMLSVPADFKSGTRSADNQEKFHEINFNTRNMPPEVTPEVTPEGQRAAQPVAVPAANPAPVAVDQNAIRMAERTRIADINLVARNANIDDEAFVTGLIDNGSTVEQARSAILDKLIETQGTPTRTQAVVIGVEAVDKKRALMENAIMHRANPAVVLIPEAREFRGMTLLDMARESVEAAGGKTRGMSRMEIAKAALNLTDTRSAGMLSTSDFPILLGNTVNSVLAREYALQTRTFPLWATRGTVKDFKEKAIVSVGDFSNFDEVKEGGEYTYGTFGEGAEKLKVVKYGKIIAITWESLINDDLDIFSKVPRFMANAAARKQSDLVYSILLDNPKMSDGKALFHTDHKNLATGSILDSTNIGLARKLLRNQTSNGGKDKLDITGKFLIVGADQEEAALQYASSKFVPTEMNKQNVWAGLFQPIVESRITGNQWFLAADPNEIDTVEYSFLEGQPELFTEQRVGFDVDGLEIKARMVFGAKAVDYRGLAKNPGA